MVPGGRIVRAGIKKPPALGVALGSSPRPGLGENRFLYDEFEFIGYRDKEIHQHRVKMGSLSLGDDLRRFLMGTGFFVGPPGD
jgi:hypothetical protein